VTTSGADLALPRARRRLIPWSIERRPDPSGIALYRIVAVLAGLGISLLVAPLFANVPAGEFYAAVWSGTLGSPLGLSNVLTIAVPLTLAALAAAIPYRLGLWNVGIDGQMLMGAWFATWVAVILPEAPGPVLIPLMLVAGMLGGLLWIVIPTWARLAFGVSEVITTFLLNFVAVAWVVYWATGAWRAKNAAGGIRAERLPEQSWIGDISVNEVLVNWGIVIAIILPIGFWLASRFTRSGYEVTITGDNPEAGRYAGMHVRRIYITSMLLGGAIAGLAGTINMMGTSHQLSPGLTNNTGFNGLVIAVLAGANELGVLALSGVYSLLLAGGGSLGIVGVNSNLVLAVIGITLIFGSFGEAYARLRLVRTRQPAKDLPGGSGPPGPIPGEVS
jgi:simple sugar transport system permease protein